jgi:hypothetical protein
MLFARSSTHGTLSGARRVSAGMAFVFLATFPACQAAPDRDAQDAQTAELAATNPPPPPPTCTPQFVLQKRDVAQDTIEALWETTALTQPEYHDCQRLAQYQGTNLGYGALASVFRVSGQLVLPQSGGPPILVAVIEVDSAKDYPDVELLDSLNCVFVDRQSVNYRVYIKPIPRMPCGQPPTNPSAAMFLTLGPLEANAADVPRWLAGMKNSCRRQKFPRLVSVAGLRVKRARTGAPCIAATRPSTVLITQTTPNPH